MHELIVNLHIHSIYSDGSQSHKKIAEAAIISGVDVIIITDHNIKIKNLDGYIESNGKRVLMLTGEEVHDMTCLPPRNHLLVLNSESELTTFGVNSQWLIDRVGSVGGLSFLAHPFEQDMLFTNEPGIPWTDWEDTGFTGIELWNGFSDIRRAKNMLHAILLAFFPEFISVSPQERTLQKWDELLSTKKKVVAIGGSDAHALHLKLGLLKRVVFPYSFHFTAINTHLYIPQPLSGIMEKDRELIYKALGQGNAFIGYDLPAPTKGFRFTAQGKSTQASLGEEIEIGDGITFQINLPVPCECRLLKDGQVIKQWEEHQIHTYISKEPGVYRIECYVDFLGQKRGWIFTNPIYVKS